MRKLKFTKNIVNHFSGSRVPSTSNVQGEDMVKHTIRVQEQKISDPLFAEDMDLKRELTGEGGWLEKVLKK